MVCIYLVIFLGSKIEKRMRKKKKKKSGLSMKEIANDFEKHDLVYSLRIS